MNGKKDRPKFVGGRRPTSVLALLTDLIFVTIAVYLLLNYASMLLIHVETTLFEPVKYSSPHTC